MLDFTNQIFFITKFLTINDQIKNFQKIFMQFRHHKKKMSESLFSQTKNEQKLYKGKFVHADENKVDTYIEECENTQMNCSIKSCTIYKNEM